MTTTSSELCEDTDLRSCLIAGLEALFAEVLAPAELGKPGCKGFFATRHAGRMFSMSWRFDEEGQVFWPKNVQPLAVQRSITIHVDKEFVGEQPILLNGTAHPNFVNGQGIISFREEEAVKIFSDTSDLRWN